VFAVCQTLWVGLSALDGIASSLSSVYFYQPKRNNKDNKEKLLGQGHTKKSSESKCVVFSTKAHSFYTWP
jgi:hypothetical protein